MLSTAVLGRIQPPGTLATTTTNTLCCIHYVAVGEALGSTTAVGIRSFWSRIATSAYALELVYESLKDSLKEQQPELKPVTHESQTTASQLVGARALKELEGVSIYGAQLTKLVLGLGRVFGVMAAEAEGHAPEVNQFYLDSSWSDSNSRENGLLDSAVMHLALVRHTGTKLVEQAATQDYDYWLHPVFAPFFVYSYRRKRKMKLNGELLEGLVDRPRPTLRHILSRTSRSIQDELPEQLQLFEGLLCFVLRTGLSTRVCLAHGRS